ncbi:MAG: type II toxin-antitoxin system VapC family toxin [Epsilonproteobacteria bacterium]|nr:type II toxin-antitoxin system VapC family toxin [Campylobacterota bacterium]
MSRKIFFDTNVVLDLLDETRVGNKFMEPLLNKIAKENYIVVLSEDMLSTLYYIIPDKKRVLEFLKTVLQYWQIVSYGTEVIKEAINVAQEKQVDLEDLLQCLCAKANGCEMILTNDKKFYNCGTKIMSPKQFLERN